MNKDKSLYQYLAPAYLSLDRDREIEGRATDVEDRYRPIETFDITIMKNDQPMNIKERLAWWCFCQGHNRLFLLFASKRLKARVLEGLKLHFNDHEGGDGLVVTLEGAILDPSKT